MSGEVSFSIRVPRASALRQARDLVAELEVFEDVLHVGREPVEVCLEVRGELLAVGAGAQVAEGEPGDVVERLPRRLTQGGVLLDHAGVVEGGLHVEDRLLAALQHRVEAAQHGHGQDHVAVLAAHVEVAQDVVGNAPDVVRDPVQVAVAHVGAHSIGLPTPCPDRGPTSTAECDPCAHDRPARNSFQPAIVHYRRDG